MESDMFNNPLDGIDLGDLSLGNPAAIPAEDDLKTGTGEEEVDDSGAQDDFNFQKPSIHLPTEDQLGLDDDDTNDNFDEEPETSLWAALASEGIIELGEDEDLNEANLEWFSEKAKSKLQKDLDSAISEYKDGLPDEVKYLLENYEEGVPVHELLNAEKRVFDIANISEEALEKEGTQKMVIAEMLRLQGETEEDIRETLIDYEDSGLLSKMSKKAQTKLVQHNAYEKQRLVETRKQEEQTRKQQYQTWLTDLKDTIDKKTEIFPGIELNEKQRKDLYQGITKVDSKGKNAVMQYREKNPDFDLQVAYLATVLKGDLSALEAAAATKATRTLKEKASSSTPSSKGRGKLRDMDLTIMKNALKFK